ncbi:C-C chemokine receptor type 4-like [Aulostomus maculatus]
MTTVDYLDFSFYYSENGSVHPCYSGEIIEFGRVFITVFYSLVFIFGFIGNGLVVCVLVKHRNQTNLTDICLFNLALSDLLFILMLPFFTHYTVAREWTLGVFLCHLSGGASSTGFFSSIFFMVVMTIDRYVVIMHNHKVAQYYTSRTGVVFTVLVWMLSLCVSLPTFVFSTVTNEPQGLGCVYTPWSDAWKVYNLFAINILGLAIPLMVMVFCYSRVIPTLVRLRSAKKHRTVKLIISIVVVFLLLWAPYNISLLLEFLYSQGKLEGDCNFLKHLKLTLAVTETLAHTHCCLNPIIYAFVGEKFKKRALCLLKKCVPGINLVSREILDSSVPPPQWMPPGGHLGLSGLDL